jgi:arylsulfate sulfotransferase
MKKQTIVHRYLLFVVVLGLLLGAPLTGFATPVVTLSGSLPSPQPVGTVVTWTATATDPDPGTIMYAFNVGPQGGTLALVRDFGPTNSFRSYPALQEGTFTIQVTARNNSTGKTGTASQTMAAIAIANPSTPVALSNTANPLVVLFSTLPCNAPDSMLVAFKTATQTTSQLTPIVPCNGKSMNFYVAGMYPKTRYSLTGVYLSGGKVEGYTSTVTYTTGAIPSSVPIPTISVLSPAPPVAASEPFLLHSYLFGSQAFVQTATDLSGNVVWYYEPWDGEGGYLTRAQNGGYFWYIGNPNDNPYLQPLREFDVAGNTVVETNVGRLSEQLVAAGQPAITDVDHELRTMGNGDILMIGSTDAVLGPNIQNGADILYDLLVVLNPGLQLTWSWNAVTCGNCATELPPTRAAILGETCTIGQGGCPPLTPPNTIANDWLHANAAELAADGSILMSLRHQDWLLKIDYNNGAGTGNILWRMGVDGDFTIIGDPNDTYPWFSHQHDPEWDFTSTYLSVFDNGNTRISQNPGEFSRGQLLDINQSTMTATLIDNLNIGSFCSALGTGQMLVNTVGSVTGLHYECGTINFTSSQSQSFYPTGILNMQSGSASYRSAQMHNMYSPYVGLN